MEVSAHDLSGHSAKNGMGIHTNLDLRLAVAELPKISFRGTLPEAIADGFDQSRV